MSYAIVTAKVDPQTKKQAQETAKALGISLSMAIKGFLRQFITTKTIIFSREDEIPNEATRKILHKAELNWKKGKHSPLFKTGEESVVWLEKQKAC